MRTKIISFVVIFLFIGAGIVGIFFIPRIQVHTPVSNEPKRAIEFSLEDYAGKEVRLSDFRGTPLLVNVWASWCPFCKKELLDFAAVKREFGGRVEIIAIDRGESLEIAKKYSDELGVTNEFLFLLDPSDSFYKDNGGFSMPETIFVDKDGFVRNHKRGPMGQEEMRRRIQQAFDL